MNGSYFDYIMSSGLYYRKEDSDIHSLFSLRLPTEWTAIADEHWCYVGYSLSDIPEQGWKIHVSSSLEDAIEMLDIVSTYCYENDISFKFTRSVKALMLKNSKYGDRTASGKFITIYPKNKDTFKKVLFDLDKLLGGLKRGPYILSDMRWKNGPLYYRYGGFQQMKTPEGALAIRTPGGELVEDSRQPFYSTPKWVDIPDFLAENEHEDDEKDEKNLFQGYRVAEALHFSNGGGVYKGQDFQGNIVLMKEARPGAGLDAAGRDAIERLNVEGLVLEKLKEVPGTPEYIDMLNVWEHKFLIMEYLDKIPFGKWLSLNYPFNSHMPTKDYFADLKYITETLVNIVMDIHTCGYCHCDIQPHNILIDPQSLTPSLIDFETAVPINSMSSAMLGTPGYYDAISDTPVQKDWIGLYRVVRGALLPIGPVEVLGSFKGIEYKNWITNTFGEAAYTVLSLVIDAGHKENVNVLKSDEHLLESVELKTTPRLVLGAKLVAQLSDEVNDSVIALCNGDILQTELQFGDMSIAYGGAGCWKTLLDYANDKEGFRDAIEKWLGRCIEKISSKKLKFTDIGLLTGITGLVEICIRADKWSNAEYLLNKVSEVLSNSSDMFGYVSLESGYAGIGLAYLYAYVSRPSQLLMECCLLCFDKCKEALEANCTVKILDPLATSTGLIYGWFGVAYFAKQLFVVTHDKKYLKFAEAAFNKDLEKVVDRNDMSMLLTDDSRLMPYFSLGSAGMIAFLEKDQYSDLSKAVIRRKETLINSLTARPCAHSGLFKGAAGLLGSLLAVNSFFYKGEQNESVEKLVEEYSSLYLVEDKASGRIMCPGDFSYRFSWDIATGACGWIYALEGNPCGILPQILK